MDLQDMQTQTHNWVQDHGGYFTEDSWVQKLFEEVKELKEALETETYNEVCFEMADILFALSCIANIRGISLEFAFKEKMPLRKIK